MRPCHSFLRHERVLGIGRLVFLFRQCIPLGIGGGTDEIISYINWSLRSGCFLHVMMWARAQGTL